MKFYIAAQNQIMARAVANMLTENGHEVTARWLNKDFNRTTTYSQEDRRQIAAEDFNDIANADALVLCSAPLRASGGKFVEAGIAMGLGKKIYVLGHRENMLLWHPMCDRFNNIEDLIEYMTPSKRRRNMPHKLTTPEIVKHCFGLDLLNRETAAFLARAARRFVKMEDKQKQDRWLKKSTKLQPWKTALEQEDK